MAVTHIIYLMDGNMIGAEGANMDHIKKTLSNIRAAGVRIGDKVLARQLIAGVGSVAVSSEKEDSNLELAINNFKLFFKVTDPALILHQVETDLASQDFVTVNGEAIFNRNAFQFLQPTRETIVTPGEEVQATVIE